MIRTMDTKLRTNFALSCEQKIDARRALLLLQDSGLTLEAACQLALAQKRGTEQVTVAQGVTEFLKMKEEQVRDGHKRGDTLRWYQQRLVFLTASLGERMVASVGRDDIAKLIAKSASTASTRASNVRAVRTVWRFMMAHNPTWAGEDPTHGMSSVAPASRKDVQFFTVEQCERMLAIKDVRYRNCFALLLFSGVRPMELRGRDKPPLLWKHVNVRDRIIRVPRENSKVNLPRVIESASASPDNQQTTGLPETVWHWLVPGKPNEPICPFEYTALQAVAKRLACDDPGEWPFDGFRHTFGTYLTTAFSNAGLVATWMGHQGNTSMLYHHYMGSATKQDAMRFLSLRPENAPVVSLAANADASKDSIQLPA